MALLSLASPPKTLNPNPNPSRHIASCLIRRPPPSSRRLPPRLRCSADYGEAAEALRPAPTTPRPAEIPWSKALCNSVRLIGTVGTDVQLRQLPSGSAVAWARLGVWKSATDTTWINITFWDDLALVASEYVKKGHRIFVSGRLVSDIVDEGTEKQHIYYKVVVQQLNFIEAFQSAQLYEPGASQDIIGEKHRYHVESSAGSTEEKHGDFVSSSSRPTEELWQAFFANPLDWWDNRKNKKNPRYPDFKHKHTGEALWIEGRYNPQWVKSQLAVLDSRMGDLQDSERKPVSFMYADEFMALDAESQVPP